MTEQRGMGEHPYDVIRGVINRPIWIYATRVIASHRKGYEFT